MLAIIISQNKGHCSLRLPQPYFKGKFHLAPKCLLAGEKGKKAVKDWQECGTSKHPLPSPCKALGLWPAAGRRTAQPGRRFCRGLWMVASHQSLDTPSQHFSMMLMKVYLHLEVTADDCAASDSCKIQLQCNLIPNDAVSRLPFQNLPWDIFLLIQNYYIITDLALHDHYRKAWLRKPAFQHRI